MQAISFLDTKIPEIIEEIIKACEYQAINSKTLLSLSLSRLHSKVDEISGNLVFKIYPTVAGQNLPLFEECFNGLIIYPKIKTAITKIVSSAAHMKRLSTLVCS